jgi:hypothetical protein
MTLNARRVAPIVLLVFASISALTADEKLDPRLAQIRAVFIEKATPGEANEKVGACLGDKLKELTQRLPSSNDLDRHGGDEWLSTW